MAHNRAGGPVTPPGPRKGAGPLSNSLTPLDMVGAQLAAFRRAAGHTQETLGRTAGISRDTIASIEQGRRVMQWDTARELDALLDTKGALRVAVENLPSVDTVVSHPSAFMAAEATADTRCCARKRSMSRTPPP